MANIQGKKVAILVADGFEQVEMTEPRKALDEAGANTQLVSPSDKGKVQGFKHDQHGDAFDVDLKLADATPEDFDALVLPGGVMNPDTLRMNPDAVRFVKSFVDAGKPIAAICHGPWTLIEADGVKGRKMTSYPSLKTDLKNAGAEWVDEEVVTDNGMVTSRNPGDIPAFNRKMIEEIGEGIHGRQRPGINSQKQQPENLAAGTQPGRGPMVEPPLDKKLNPSPEMVSARATL